MILKKKQQFRKCASFPCRFVDGKLLLIHLLHLTDDGKRQLKKFQSCDDGRFSPKHGLIINEAARRRFVKDFKTTSSTSKASQCKHTNEIVATCSWQKASFDSKLAFEALKIWKHFENTKRNDLQIH